MLVEIQAEVLELADPSTIASQSAGQAGTFKALVAELADAQASEACELLARRGSTPLEGTRARVVKLVYTQS